MLEKKNFIRNNYYKGKILGADEFKLEQDYLINKRTLLNRHIIGQGVLKGLRVIKLVNNNISIEEGLAIDKDGNEIFLSDSIIKNIEEIDGYEKHLEDRDLLLAIKYDEETESIDHINSDKHKNLSHLIERAKLELVKYDEKYFDESSLGSFKKIKCLFQNKDIKLSVIYPKILLQNEELEIDFEIICFGQFENIRLKAELSLINLQGDESLDLLFEKSSFEEMRKIKSVKFKNYNLRNIESSINIDKSKFKISILDENYTIDEKIELKTFISDMYLDEMIDSEIQNREDKNQIFLSRVLFTTDNSEKKLASIINLPFSQNIYNLKHLREISKKIKGIFDKSIAETERKEEIIIDKLESISSRNKILKTNFGINKILLNKTAYKNNHFSSNELSHELGEGFVHIDIGFEEEINGENAYVLGDFDAIAKDEYSANNSKFIYGISVYPDRGSFRVHIKFTENSNAEEIKFWWFAKKDSEKQINIKEEIKVEIYPDSATLKPHETKLFKASVKGFKNQDVYWELEDLNSGKITENGLYEAPQNKGVYKITARSVENINAEKSAFVIVK